MLCRDMPEAVAQFVAEFDLCGLESALTFAEKRQRIRARLRESGEYIAFIADGSILPREKDSELPMRDAVPFVSTPGDAVEWEGVRGMAFRRGVTVITGGGYSGRGCGNAAERADRGAAVGSGKACKIGYGHKSRRSAVNWALRAIIKKRAKSLQDFKGAI